MPHLTLPIERGGPTIEVIVGVSSYRGEELRKAGSAIPLQKRIRALIDTGASNTVIDRYCVEALGLTPTGIALVHTPSTGGVAHRAEQFDVQMTMVHPRSHRTIDALPVISAALANQGIQALIGRDALAQCLFIYDGEAKTFSLAF